MFDSGSFSTESFSSVSFDFGAATPPADETTGIANWPRMEPRRRRPIEDDEAILIHLM